MKKYTLYTKEDKVLDLFYNRYNQFNTLVLEEMAKTINQFEGLTPSEAHVLARQLKTGTSMDSIIRKLERLTNLTQKEIVTLLEETAKENIEFAKPYYEYRGIKNSYQKSKEFQSIVKSVAKITNKQYNNISKTTVIMFKDINGKFIPKDLKRAYYEVIDRSVLAVTTGQKDYQTMMRKTINELKESGVRKLYYDNRGKIINGREVKNTYTRRLDSSVRMNTMDAIRQVNDGIEEQIAKEIDADGWEITHHLACAEDHIVLDGEQFTKKEFEEINNGLDRQLGQWNCRHKKFAIILGVQKPIYSKEELDRDRKINKEGLEFEGKHYSLYEAEQLQRKIETAIREQKDNQIIAKENNDKERVGETQKNIKLLTDKYKKLTSNQYLIPRTNRMTVSGYRKISVK